MSNITLLKDHADAVSAEDREYMVEQLGKMIERVKSGEVVSLACVGATRDGGTTDFQSATRNWLSLFAGVRLLVDRLSELIRDDGEASE